MSKRKSQKPKWPKPPSSSGFLTAGIQKLIKMYPTGFVAPKGKGFKRSKYKNLSAKNTVKGGGLFRNMMGKSSSGGSGTGFISGTVLARKKKK